MPDGQFVPAHDKVSENNTELKFKPLHPLCVPLREQDEIETYSAITLIKGIYESTPEKYEK